MPLLRRNYQQLARLAPTAVAPTINDMTIYKSGTLTTGNYYQVGGARGSYISYTTDGVDNQDIWWQSAAVIPPLDSIQEFNVQISNVPAEYGRGAVQFTNTIRQGTNAIHGTAYEYLQNADLDANSYFANQTNTPRTPFRKINMGPRWEARSIRENLFLWWDTRDTVTTRARLHSQTGRKPNGCRKVLAISKCRRVPCADLRSRYARPDGNGGYIRDPFPGNIIPSGSNQLRYPRPDQVHPPRRMRPVFFPAITTKQSWMRSKMSIKASCELTTTCHKTTGYTATTCNPMKMIPSRPSLPCPQPL